MKLITILFLLALLGCADKSDQKERELELIQAQVQEKLKKLEAREAEFAKAAQEKEKKEEEVVEETKPLFKSGECIFGGSGNKESGHNDDQGYKIVSVDTNKDQYLLKCLTSKKCNGGLKTWWISQFDNWMLKVNCDEIEELHASNN